MLVSVLYQNFVGARRAFATGARFGLACVEERKKNSHQGLRTAVCLPQQPELARRIGPGPSLRAGSCLGADGLKQISVRCWHSSAALNTAWIAPRAAFASL